VPLVRGRQSVHFRSGSPAEEASRIFRTFDQAMAPVCMARGCKDESMMASLGTLGIARTRSSPSTLKGVKPIGTRSTPPHGPAVERARIPRPDTRPHLTTIPHASKNAYIDGGIHNTGELQ